MSYLQSNTKIIQNKLGLLNLATELGSRFLETLRRGKKRTELTDSDHKSYFAQLLCFNFVVSVGNVKKKSSSNHSCSLDKDMKDGFLSASALLPCSL